MTSETFFGGRHIGRTPKLSATEITAIQEDLRTPGATRTSVAKKRGMSPSTVIDYFDKFGNPTEKARKVLSAPARKRRNTYWELDEGFDQDTWGDR